MKLKSWFEENCSHGCVIEWVYGIDDGRVYVALKQKDGTLVNQTWLPPLLMGYLADMVHDNWVKIDKMERARIEAITTQDPSKFIKEVENQEHEQVQPIVDSVPFRCSCGCNVFSDMGKMNTGETLYRCNACGEEYAGSGIKKEKDEDE